MNESNFLMHARRTLSFLSTILAVLGLAGGITLWGTHRASASTTVNAGDLIRGTTFSAVYYMGADGFRYVFPNDKTYFTWYTDFSSVKFLSDADLAKIQMGGNVTYKGGSKMIKINTDPKVYFVTDGGVLRPVADETTATLMYGSQWNKMIDDVPDGFFANYSVSTDAIASADADIVNEAFASTINEDKALKAPEEIDITSNGYSPIDVTIDAGETVRFTNSDSQKHTATADDLTWGTGTMAAGGTFVRRFNEAGTYTFFDSYDSGNTGAIYVRE
jgi:plastocyanin